MIGGRRPFEVHSFLAAPIGIMLKIYNIGGTLPPVPPVAEPLDGDAGQLREYVRRTLADPGGGVPPWSPQKARKGANIFLSPPSTYRKHKCGVTGMTNKYFLTGQCDLMNVGKKGEYHIDINAPKKYLHSLSKTIYIYHFPTYCMNLGRYILCQK